MPIVGREWIGSRSNRGGGSHGSGSGSCGSGIGSCGSGTNCGSGNHGNSDDGSSLKSPVTEPDFRPRFKNADSVRKQFPAKPNYPHGESNPGFRTENPTSWATRRWGRRGRWRCLPTGLQGFICDSLATGCQPGGGCGLKAEDRRFLMTAFGRLIFVEDEGAGPR